MNRQIQQLQQELYSVLKQAERNRRKIRFSRILCYGGAALYFLGILGLQIFIYSGGSGEGLFYTLNPNPSFFEQYKLLICILPVFILITFGGWGLGFFYKNYTATEQTAIRRILTSLFPGAKCSLSPSQVSQSLVQQSNFFGSMKHDSSVCYSFGSVSFENNGRKIIFRDIVLNKGASESWLSESVFGAMFFIFKMLFSGLFAKRTENMGGSFRGMFASAQLEKKINGSVVVLPDRLESKLDYLAKNIQMLKNVNGNRLVSLEDVEFERYFAVYASDEITARYVLTPAMMLRMTELKRKYNRDIMLSFSGSLFFFAVAMPEGFLTLGNASLTSGTALNDLYANFSAAQKILDDLKLR
jgi:hypothetical protein